MPVLVDDWRPPQPDFCLVRPEDARTSGARFTLEVGAHRHATLLELPGMPIDWINTRLPRRYGALRERLRGLSEIPRMSTLANAALLNAAVSQMKAEHAYVNVGVWNGFTLLAGMVGNPARRCIGIDDFSEFGGPRDALTERFAPHRSPLHDFHDMSYEDYFRDVHQGPIGVYLYDGEHSYEHQRRGLEVAERFFADGCLIVVDDGNLPNVRQATRDFANDSRHGYELLLDATTFGNAHPTYWNGLLVLRCRKTGPTKPVDGAHVESGPGPARVVDSGDGQHFPDLFHDEPAETRDSDPTVSLVLCHERGNGEQLSTAVERARSQTWPALEVIVADSSNGNGLTVANGDIRGEVACVVRKSSFTATVQAAAAKANGQFVAFLDSSSMLADTAVHLALGYPAYAAFFSGPLKEWRRAELERGLRTGKDVEGVVTPGAICVLGSRGVGLPQTVRGRRFLRLFRLGERPADVDDSTAIERLESLRSVGATHVVLLWSIFKWFANRPLFAAQLDGHDRVLETSQALVFRLRG